MSLVQSGTNLRPNLFAMALCMLHRCCTVKQIHSSLLACVLLVSNVFGGIVIDEEEVNGALQSSLLLGSEGWQTGDAVLDALGVVAEIHGIRESGAHEVQASLSCCLHCAHMCNIYDKQG